MTAITRSKSEIISNQISCKFSDGQYSLMRISLLLLTMFCTRHCFASSCILCVLPFFLLLLLLQSSKWSYGETIFDRLYQSHIHNIAVLKSYVVRCVLVLSICCSTRIACCSCLLPFSILSSFSCLFCVACFFKPRHCLPRRHALLGEDVCACMFSTSNTWNYDRAPRS